MMNFYTSTPVVNLGAGPLSRANAGEKTIALLLYNNNAAIRTITVAMTGTHAFTFDIGANTPEMLTMDVTGDLTVTSSGSGVFAWTAQR